ncbi:hypothetical protein NQ777_15830 [Acinetobacter baumannii]|nr:hypothetical protein [Acinetobacter baumannii]
MQTVTQQQFLEIANKLAQQQDEYFEGFIIDECNIFANGMIHFGAKGLDSAKKIILADKIRNKIEPILRANYIVVG